MIIGIKAQIRTWNSKKTAFVSVDDKYNLIESHILWV